MKIIPALAGTAVSAVLLSATPSQAQFFDTLFTAPATVATGAVGVATGAVGTATNVVGAATGGFFGAGYPNGYNYGWGYPGYNTAYNTTWSPIWGYTQTDPVYGTPTYTGRSAYRSYRQWRRSMDNPYN